jgi:hypothetical protein
MKSPLNIAAWAAVSLLVFAVICCKKLDVVGNYSVLAFDKLLHNAPELVSEDNANGFWSLSAPDSGARFIWRRTFAEDPLYDVMLEINADPFIAAGLDPSRLPGEFIFKNGVLTVGIKLENKQLRYQGELTPLSSYEHIITLKRSVIGYHGAMDHFGINLGNGNMFEWAKDMNTNDKDIVFALNPEPFISAGVEPDRIKGWVFTKVPAEDERGRMIEADKILKPVDLL